MWWLLADEFGGIHLEALGELAERGHARLYFVALDTDGGRRGEVGLAPNRKKRRVEGETRGHRALEALENSAAELERLRILREHEKGVRIVDEEGSLHVRPAG